MNRIEFAVTVNHGVEFLATNILENYGSDGVVIEDSNDLINQPTDKLGEAYKLKKEDYPEQGVRLKAYFNELKYDTQLKNKLENEILDLDLIDDSVAEFSAKTIAEVDWANEQKNYFHPFRASKRLTIVPSWKDYLKESEDELCIELDPGMVFGTGDHPTTSMCLKAIETYVTPDSSVIDAGTGSDISSIASHLIGVKQIKALGIDETAADVAKKNFRKNHCEDDTEAIPDSLLKEENEKFDVVIVNILAHIIDETIENVYNTLSEDGYFITLGIIEEKHEDILSHMKHVGFNIVSINHDNGWACIVGQKVSE